MKEIYVCTNYRHLSAQPSCAARGSEALLEMLQTAISERQLDCQVMPSVCMGHCQKGPNIKVLGEPCCHHMDDKGVVALLDELAQDPGNQL